MRYPVSGTGWGVDRALDTMTDPNHCLPCLALLERGPGRQIHPVSGIGCACGKDCAAVVWFSKSAFPASTLAINATVGGGNTRY